MARLAQALEREGYMVVNVSYASRIQSLETLATDWLPALVRTVDPRQPVHFVTHSMGGILVRLWLRERGAPQNLGRVVMLAPPNAGSEIPDRLNEFRPYRWFMGPNGSRLGTNPEALPRAIGPWRESGPGRGELGIIAGNASLNPLFAAWLPAPNDGKVSVATTHLAGERDHLVLPFTHTWLGWRGETIRQVSTFLRTGQFSHHVVPAVSAKAGNDG
jgi:hypothetical protein